MMLISPHLVYGANQCKTERGQSFAEQLAKLEPKFDLKFLDLDVLPKGSFVAGYEYEVDSAYTKGLYSRSDSWQIGLDGIPNREHDITKGFSAKLKAGADAELEAKFVRFFKDPCSAMKAKPYDPRRIPLRSNVAISDKFNVGDYFLFRGSVGVVATGELLNMMGTSFWGAGLSLSYLVRAFYQIHIVRLDQKHIRLKVVAHRGSVKEGSLGIGFEHEFEVFGFNSLNNAAERFLNTKPIKIKVDQKKSDVVLVDYILDLTNPEVAAAFERILPSAKEFKNLAKLETYKSINNLASNVLLDLTPLEEIFRKDFENSRVGRLQRNLKTNSNQNLIEYGIHAGNKILGLKFDKRSSTGLMSLLRPNDTFDRYLLKSWESVRERRAFISVYRHYHEEAFRALFVADESFKELKTMNIAKHITMKKSAIDFSSFNKLKARLYKILPNEVFQQIPWNRWAQTPKTKFDNFGLRFEYTISPEVIYSLPEYRAEEIKVFLDRYLASKNLVAKDFLQVMESDFQTAESVFQDRLQKVSRTLENALSKKKTSLERVELISELKSDEIFGDMGVGFLASLNPAMLEKWSHLSLDISSNQALIEVDYGATDMMEVYKKILLIKAALDDDGLDPLLEAESISIPRAG